MVTVAEAAGELGLTVRGVQYRLKHGLLRGENIAGRAWLIPRAEIERAKGVRPRSPAPSSTRARAKTARTRVEREAMPDTIHPPDIEYPIVLDVPQPVTRTYTMRLERIADEFDGFALTPDEWEVFGSEEQDGG
jgi:hypothetical protein